MKYTIYYWISQGEKSRSVSETLPADSMDDITRQIQYKLAEQHSFSIDSDNDGRVIVISSKVQFVEVEPATADAVDNLPEGFRL